MQPLFSPSASSQDGPQSEFIDGWQSQFCFLSHLRTIQYIHPQLSLNKVRGSLSGFAFSVQVVFDFARSDEV